MVQKKRQSKRMSLSKKYKIEKKVREHHRKVRKEQKKKEHKRIRKDPGIPNLYPFKEELLEQIKRRKEETDEEKKKQREQKEKEKQKQKASGETSKLGELARLQFEAQRRQSEFEQRSRLLGLDDDGEKTIRKDALSHTSKKAYYREFKKVVEAADVILEVLDARDPIGCRSPEIEKTILSHSKDKKIVLILNKIDLVPREVVEQWLLFLRNQFPTLAFKCSTQSNANTKRRKYKNANTGDINMADETSSMMTSATQNETGLLNDTSSVHTSRTRLTTASQMTKGKNAYHTSDVVGADTLVQLLKNYSRSKNIKKNITVGIIGYPNVGKSSLINSLKRTKVVNVGNTPGLTKASQEILLDSNIKLLDCPGIIFSSADLDSDLILRNCVKIEQLDDFVGPVEVIMGRVGKERIQELYALPKFDDTQQFLAMIAQRKGKLLKGGVPDVEAAGRIVLNDWTTGKIPYYTLPPENMDNSPLAGLISKPIASTSSELKSDDFDLDDLILQTERVAISNLPSLSTNANKFIALPSSGYGKAQLLDGDEEDVDMEDEEDDEDYSDNGEDDDDDDEEMEN